MNAEMFWKYESFASADKKLSERRSLFYRIRLYEFWFTHRCFTRLQALMYERSPFLIKTCNSLWTSASVWSFSPAAASPRLSPEGLRRIAAVRVTWQAAEPETYHKCFIAWKIHESAPLGRQPVHTAKCFSLTFRFFRAIRGRRNIISYVNNIFFGPLY